MTYRKTRILVVVKTYPNLSKKYDRTVCIAGIDLSTNEWMRIFPVRFFDLPASQRPKKYDIIEADVELTRDKFLRKESHKVKDEKIKVTGSVDTAGNWAKRNKIIFPLLKMSVEKLNNLYSADRTSIGIIRPKEIQEFKIVPIDECRNWEKDLITGSQTTLSERAYKTPLDKIPYKFSYVFVCDDSSCKGHDMMIEDWELCQLYRSVKEKEGNDAALNKVRQQYFDNFVKTKNLHLVLGTESQWNQWIIIGVYYPKK